MKVVDRLWNIYYCCAEFLKVHKIRLIIFAVIFVIACAFGVKAGCSCDAADVLSNRSIYTMIVDAQNRNIVGFIFLNLICYLICLALLCVFGFNFYTSLIGVLIFFYVSYMTGYSAALYIAYFKLASLPYVIIVYIPSSLVMSFSLGCAVSLSLNCGLQMRRNGCFCMQTVIENLPPYLIFAAVTVLSVLYLGIFGGIFTAGLII